MKIVIDPIELKMMLKEYKKEQISEQDCTIGFVPTMGALHEGHISLIREAKAKNSLCVVSVFVNPTQFLKGEDLERYPRRDEADKEICRRCGVDILFMPHAKDIYQEDEASIVAPLVRGYILEGSSRPGHFNGVLSVVMKLFNIVSPTRAYFGKKDAQQLYLISLMVEHFFMDIEIVAMQTMRDATGLALSSRNTYLSQEERQEALKIPASLQEAGRMVAKGVMDVAVIEQKMRERLSGLEVEYLVFVERAFRPIATVELHNTLILVAAKVGGVRLIDNLWL